MATATVAEATVAVTVTAKKEQYHHHHAQKLLPHFLIAAIPESSTVSNRSRTSSSSNYYASEDSHQSEIRDDPRSYQLQLFEEAQKHNIIAILDTGTGKTLIAALLIKHYIALQMDAEAKDPNTEKRVAFFLVPTVPLAWQQKRQLLTMVDKVGVVIGELANARTKANWDTLLKSHHAIVCTPAILKNALEAGFVTMLQVLMIVFDEAHHAIGNADYAIIMDKYYPNLNDFQAYKPRVLGLTASPVTGDTDDPIKAIQALEVILKSTARTIIWTDHKGFKQLGQGAQLERLWYNAAPAELPQSELLTTLKALIKNPPTSLDISEDVFFSLKVNDIAVLEFEILRPLGSYACDRAIEMLLYGYHRKLMIRDNFKSMKVEDLLAVDESHDIDADEDLRKTSLLGRISHLFPGNSLPPNSISDKVDRLFGFLCDYYNKEPSFRGIIFVQRRMVADRLSDLIKKDSRLTFCRVAVLKGHGGRPDAKQNDDVMSQINVVEDFRVNKLNLLVATAVAEEGLDIPECNLVVRFDPRNMQLGSLIQSRGRARTGSNAKFVVMLEQHHGQDSSILMKLCSQEQGFRRYLEQVSKGTDPKARYEELLIEEASRKEIAGYTHEPYRIESTGATLQLASAISLLNRFCQGVGETDGYDWRVSWSYESMTDGQFMVTLTLPGTLPKELRMHKGGPAHKVTIAQQMAAFNALRVLHKEEYFDDHMQPIKTKNFIKHTSQDEDKIHMENQLNALRGRRRKRLYQRCVPEDMTADWIDIELPAAGVEFSNHSFDVTISAPVTSQPNGTACSSSENMQNSCGVNDTCESKKNIRRKAWLCIPYTIKGASDEMYRVGVLARREPTTGIEFSLWPSSGEVKMKMVTETQPILMSESEWRTVTKFHCYLMTSFLKDAVHRKLDHGYYCVLLKWEKDSPSIDWKRTFEIADHNPKDYHRLLYTSDIVGRIVQDRSYYDRQYAVVAFRSDLRPSHPIPPEYKCRSKSAHQKYTASGKFKYKPINPDQPLLFGHIMRLTRRLNMLHDTIVEEVREAKQYEDTPLLPDWCSLYPLTVAEFNETDRVPSILYYFEIFSVAYDLKQRLKLPPPVGSILQAITAPSSGLPFSYERLETLGDSFLKMAINLHLYARLPLRDEGHLSLRTNFLVSNYQLFLSASLRGIPEALNAVALSRTTWRPIGSGWGRWEEREKGRQERGTEAFKPPPGTHILSDKQVADVVESLLGSAVITGDPQTHGVDNGAKAMKAIYSDASEDDWTKYYDAIKRRVPGHDGLWRNIPGMELLIKQVEGFLGYKFANPGWLIEALTHSTAADQVFNSYQRLEFLGDAALGYLAVRHFYYTFPEANPHQLSDLKDAAVCNAFLANIAVSAGMHRWMRHMSAPLMQHLQGYLNDLAAERANIETSDKSVNDDSRRYWEDIESIPKAASDVVEALLGAVFVDSKLSTMAVWRVLERIWVPWVDIYIKPTTIKTISVRVLSEQLLNRGCQDFKVKAYLVGPRAFVSKVIIHAKVFAEAKGEIRKKATQEASEIALKKLRDDPNSFIGLCDCKPDAMEEGVYIKGSKKSLEAHEISTTVNKQKDDDANSHSDGNNHNNSVCDDGSDVDSELEDEDCDVHRINGSTRHGEIIAKVAMEINSRKEDEGYREYDHEYTDLEEADGEVVAAV